MTRVDLSQRTLDGKHILEDLDVDEMVNTKTIRIEVGWFWSGIITF